MKPAAMLGALLLVLLGAVAWKNASEIHWAARAFLVLLTVPIPALAIAQAAALSRIPDFPRIQAYISSIVTLWFLATLCIIASRTAGFTATDLGIVVITNASVALWVSVCVAAAALFYVIGRAMGIQESEAVLRLLPESSKEKLWFTAVSITAGSCEELIFRGFCVFVLAQITGSTMIAVFLAAAIFGILHAYQGINGVMRVTALGIVLAAPLVFTGSLLPGMIAHTLIDLIAGLILPRYIDRTGV